MENLKLNQKEEQLTLVATWWINDDWYGKGKRVLLTGNFKTKSEAKKYSKKMKSYIMTHFNKKITSKDLQVEIYSTFKSYIHCSFGPSQSWNHFDITIEDLENF